MTGLGLAEVEEGDVSVRVEIKSVNHKFIDVKVKSNLRSMAIDDLVKKEVRSSFDRGYFETGITITFTGDSISGVETNEPLLKSYMKIAKDLAEKYDVDYPPKFGEIVSLKDVFVVQTCLPDIKSLTPLLLSALKNACAELRKARQSEGEQTLSDIRVRFLSIKELVEKIDVAEQKEISAKGDRLMERVAKLAEPATLDKDRLAQEVALLVDRADISEERERVASHLKQIDRLLDNGGSVGRKLDFFLQELGREINTMGAKSVAGISSGFIVEIKSSLEKIREQTQNLE